MDINWPPVTYIASNAHHLLNTLHYFWGSELPSHLFCQMRPLQNLFRDINAQLTVISCWNQNLQFGLSFLIIVGPSRDLFLYFLLFTIQLTDIFLPMLGGSNRGSLVSEETALPTVPQPRPHIFLFLMPFGQWVHASSCSPPYLKIFFRRSEKVWELRSYGPYYDFEIKLCFRAFWAQAHSLDFLGSIFVIWRPKRTSRAF